MSDDVWGDDEWVWGFDVVVDSEEDNNNISANDEAK